MKKTLIALALTASLFAGSTMAASAGTATLGSSVALFAAEAPSSGKMYYVFDSVSDATAFKTAVENNPNYVQTKIQIKRVASGDVHVLASDVAAALAGASGATSVPTVAAAASFLEGEKINAVAFEPEGSTTATAAATAFLRALGLTGAADKPTLVNQDDAHVLLRVVATSKN